MKYESTQTGETKPENKNEPIVSIFTTKMNQDESTQIEDSALIKTETNLSLKKVKPIARRL